MKEWDVESARRALYGLDPVAGDDALSWLLVNLGEQALHAIIPPPSDASIYALQVECRVSKLVSSLKTPDVDRLLEFIRSGSEAWTVHAAAIAFGGLANHRRAESALVETLKIQGAGMPVLRASIEALGYRGANEWIDRLINLAHYDSWETPRGPRGPNEYSLGKLNGYVFDALLRSFSRCDEEREVRFLLGQFKALRRLCKEVLGQDVPMMGEIYRLARCFKSTSADAVHSEWLKDSDPFVQQAALAVLSNLRLDRTVRWLLEILADHNREPEVRSSADVQLSSFCSVSAADQLARHLSGKSDPGRLRWAFSALYAIPAPWPICDERIDEILGSGGEPRQQLLFALACREDERARTAAEEGLSSQDEYVRGTSALSLARIDASAAQATLPSREQEAASPLERAYFQAAQVHCGLHERAADLEETLRELSLLTMLRPIWKRQLLSAFFVVDGPDSRRGKLWCEAAAEAEPRLKTEMAALARPRRKSPPVAVSTSISESIPASSSSFQLGPIHQYHLFISHASEDKETVARPLFKALTAAGLKVWFDAATLKLGDSLRRKIDDGLAHSRYGVVILSPRFLAKEWPQRELDGLSAREMSGTKAILPIWVEVDGELIAKQSPTLADRLACRWDEGLDAVVAQILAVFRD